MCPNCHSQTSTFSGLNKKVNKKIYKCFCGENEIRKGAKYCDLYRPKPKTKNEWPEHKALIKRLENISCSQLALELGVSDNAIRNRIAKYSEVY